MLADLHPDAAKSFSQRASALLEALQDGPQQHDQQFAGPTPHVSAAFGKDDILSIGPMSEMDVAGQEVGRFGYVGDKLLGFRGERYGQFAALAEALTRSSALANAVSLATVKDLLFDWVLKARAAANPPDASAALLNNCRQLVKRYTVAIPVYDLALEAPRSIGNVELRPVSAQTLEEWAENLRQHHPSMASMVSIVLDKWRPRFQGRAAAFFTADAEKRRAQELAYEETEKALAALRVFSPGNLHARAQTVCVPWGKQQIQTEYLMLIEESRVVGDQSRMLEFGPPGWLIPASRLDEMWQAGLKDLSEIVRHPDASELSADLLESLLVYSRAALSNETSEKLLHVFRGLESLLLRSDNEPIQAGLADRIAFLAGPTADERIAISRDVKDAYNLRSRFVHHNARIADFATVQRLLFAAYHAILAVAKGRELYPSRDALLNAIERRKYA